MKRIDYLIGICLLMIIMLGVKINELSAEVFDIKIREFDTGILLTNKVFSWSNISVLTNGWKLAREYVEIDYLTTHSVITGWGLQIYTYNRTNIANPQYTGTMDNPGGMISSINSNNLISLAWAIKLPYDPMPITAPTESTPGVLSGGWHWMLDKSSSDFTNEKEYIVVWNQGGIAWSDAVRQHKPLKAYLYIAAKFENLISSVFRTSQLRIEEYSDTNAKFLNEFYIYKDGWYDTNPQPNHYIPAASSFVVPPLDDHWTNNVHSGKECMKITLDSVVWEGWYWLEPQHNWTNGVWGYDLTGATKLTFWARGENGGEHVCFKMGDSHDSCGVVKVDGSDPLGYINLTSSWSQYQITLTNKDLSYVHLGFLCGIWDETNVTFYLDDIKYEK